MIDQSLHDKVNWLDCRLMDKLASFDLSHRVGALNWGGYSIFCHAFFTKMLYIPHANDLSFVRFPSAPGRESKYGDLYTALPLCFGRNYMY